MATRAHQPETEDRRDATATVTPRIEAAPAPLAKLLQLQRSAGNRAVAGMIAAPGGATLARADGTAAQAGPATTGIAQAITDRDTDAIGAIGDFSSATDAQRVELIEILLDQIWVGPRDEAALERIWASFGPTLPETMACRARLWRDCVDRGASLPRWTRQDNLELTCEIQPGVISARQAGRVPGAVDALSIDDYLQLRQLMFYAGSGMELAFICKALAANRGVADIASFANAIRGKDSAWLLANLNVADETTAQGATSTTGIQQQWQMSCGPTTVQTLHAQTDPIYALSLTSAGSVHGQAMANTPMTVEQGAILIGQGSVPTPVGTAGQGAWVESDLNALSAQTGVTYTFTAVTAVTPANAPSGAVDQAVTSILGFLGQGIQVPLVIGGTPGQTAHYVMALRANGDSMLVHDPGSGSTAWVTRAQFLANTLSPPLSWSLIAGYDRPAATP